MIDIFIRNVNNQYIDTKIKDLVVCAAAQTTKSFYTIKSVH